MPKRRCPDCHAQPGKVHDPGCDVETCPECGLQRLSCGCHSNLKPVPWEGESVLARDARRNGLYAKLTDTGWATCAKDDPHAEPDLNSVPGRLAWNKAKQRWEPKPPRLTPDIPLKGRTMTMKAVKNGFARAALVALVRTVESNGGIFFNEESQLWALVEDRDWADMADAYRLACAAMNRKPKVKASSRLDDARIKKSELAARTLEAD